jgi:hypothetical protein
MAFFEDLGKKVSQTGQDAIKKTKILAETTKINSQISGEKRVIAENFSKLGEKYCELYSDSPDENLAPFIAAVREAYQKIADYEEQIIRLKGAECCPKCGAEIKDGAQFCVSCGARFEPATPAADTPTAQPLPRVCRGCGAPLADGVRFCGSCGAKCED